MSQESKNNQGLWPRFVSEILAFSPKGIKELVGVYVGTYLFVFTPIVVASAAIALIIKYFLSGAAKGSKNQEEQATESPKRS